jgi:hypothetical protein
MSENFGRFVPFLRDETLCGSPTCGFIFGSALKCLEVPQGRYNAIVQKPSVVPAGRWGILRPIRRLKPTVNKVQPRGL